MSSTMFLYERPPGRHPEAQQFPKLSPDQISGPTVEWNCYEMRFRASYLYPHCFNMASPDVTPDVQMRILFFKRYPLWQLTR